MGQALAVVKAVQSFDDKSEGEKEANDALNCLVTLAQNRLDRFYRRITSPQYDPKTIPISKVLYRYQFFRCGVDKNTASVKEAITCMFYLSSLYKRLANLIEASLGDFATGDVVCNSNGTLQSHPNSNKY
ncbi:hypothetical protein SERLA73DRAFT_133450 [Serpula lacrymans var. lacrymans S7.3]|uniref:Uncharacterized protein n=2 Tax=Serpula lacrymans var. lacrymans TaxID=341189 RepID=F8PTJ9_SERL3|nr:uncharacterized protein SERLADRAFT_384316 [Serpula lacrymans var. lacrymans S7.9]EGO00527.1 hypothetical protein SERLA73DRAFT_133450 [Serpula lacrymans var. lacrymans S7.3]EGO26086.1 hypothetical protein SERLADRAFT_384316 [Serpula lacrymans var. lacrymans S7.9]